MKWLSCGQLREQGIAGLLTPAARLGADATVLHAMLGMLLAFITTEFACLRACLEKRPAQRRLERRLARLDITGCRADVGAVQIEADAADQHLNLLFTKAGIGAGGASLRAIETRADALDERAQVNGRFLGS